MTQQTAPTEMNRAEFIAIVRIIQNEAEQSPVPFPNGELALFLEALSGWVEDMDGYYRNRGEIPPVNVPWRVMADALRAARVYE